MIKPTCQICNKELLGGYQEIIHADIEKKELPKEEKDGLLALPEQKAYFAHNPNNLHQDIEVFAHMDCFNKVKENSKYKDFDKPTEKDLLKPVFPKIISGGIVELK